MSGTKNTANSYLNELRGAFRASVLCAASGAGGYLVRFERVEAPLESISAIRVVGTHLFLIDRAAVGASQWQRHGV